MARFTYGEIVASTSPLTNWSKFAVHPLSDRLLWVLANYAPVHPNWLTLTAFALGGGAASCFLRGDRTVFIVGALLFYVSFALDTIDGALARLTNQASAVGAWLDTITDFIRSVALVAALSVGAWRATDDPVAIYAGFAAAGVSALYYYLAEVSQRIAGHRPHAMVKSLDHPLTRGARRLGIVPTPFGLADFEAVCLVIFPIAGRPIEGLLLASGLGGLTRLATAVFVLRTLRRPPRVAA